MVDPYASADMVRLYAPNLDTTFTDTKINQYTLNEDRFTVDTALKTGMNVSVPLTDPPEVIKVLSAKCSALSIMRAIYGGNIPNKSSYNDFKVEVEQFLINLRAGEIEV
jgi:hypothetical protein